MSTALSRSRKFLFRNLALASLGLYLLLQLPFLHADPHQFIYFGRDAFTDEALGINQIINWVENGTFSVLEGDNLMKTPLFNLQQAIPLLIDNSRESARIWMLILMTVCLLGIARSSARFSVFLPFFLGLGLLHYDNFQYFHHSQPEAIASCLILLGIALLHRWINDPRYRSMLRLILMHLAFAAAGWQKNQFFYICALPSGVFLSLWITQRAGRKEFLQSVLINAGLVIFYMLAWYLPMREAFEKVMSEMLHSRFAPASIFFDEVWENTKRAFLSTHEIAFTLAFLVALGFGVYLSRHSRYTFKSGYYLLLFWFALELHKLGIRWVPTRYLISLYFSMGAMIAWVAMEAYQHYFATRRRQSPVFYALAISLLIFAHGRNLLIMAEQRSYVMTEIKEDMKKVDFKGRYAIGAWAPSLTWGANVRTMPAWKDYFNDTNIIEVYKPKLIITEHDEADANGLYSARGIDLRARCDSVQYRQVGAWKLALYWFK